MNTAFIKKCIRWPFKKLKGLFAKDVTELDMQAIKRLVGHSDALIFEIGSANGQDSAEFLKTFTDSHFRLYGFEPEPKNIALIEKHIQDRRFSLFKGAVSDQSGMTSFNRSRSDNPEDLSLSGSLMKPKNHLKTWTQIYFDQKIEVPTITLDEFCKKNSIGVIDFIWCDVQGAEEKIIRGGAETFARKVRYFYTEYSNNEYYEGQPTRDMIIRLLPDFKVVRDFGTDILLKNKHL